MSNFGTNWNTQKEDLIYLFRGVPEPDLAELFESSREDQEKAHKVFSEMVGKTLRMAETPLIDLTSDMVEETASEMLAAVHQLIATLDFQCMAQESMEQRKKDEETWGEDTEKMRVCYLIAFLEKNLRFIQKNLGRVGSIKSLVDFAKSGDLENSELLWTFVHIQRLASLFPDVNISESIKQNRIVSR